MRFPVKNPPDVTASGVIYIRRLQSNKVQVKKITSAKILAVVTTVTEAFFKTLWDFP
jgi:hypothetical protein